MPDILIRKVDEETYSKLKAKAQASKEGALEPWLKSQLEILAEGPIIKERYTIRIGGKGQIRRFGDSLTSPTYKDTSECLVGIIEQATALIKRNSPGDREEALWLLRNHFDDVYET